MLVVDMRRCLKRHAGLAPEIRPSTICERTPTLSATVRGTCSVGAGKFVQSANTPRNSPSLGFRLRRCNSVRCDRIRVLRDAGCQIVDVDHVQSGVDDAGIRPLRKSRTSFPVGVGRLSPGPSGNVGRRGKPVPLAPLSQNLVSATYLVLLYVRTDGPHRRNSFRLQPDLGGTIKSEHSDGARVDHALTRTPAGRSSTLSSRRR